MSFFKIEGTTRDFFDIGRGSTGNKILNFGVADLTKPNLTFNDSTDIFELSHPLKVAGLIESTSNGFKFPDGTTQTTAVSGSSFVTISTTQTITGAKTINNNLSVRDNFAVDTNLLFVDSTNDKIGIGTATPTYPFEVVLNGSLRLMDFKNTASGGATSIGLRGFGGALFSEFGYANPNYSIAALQDKVFLGYFSGRDLIFTNSSTAGTATAKGLSSGDWNFDPSNNTLYVDSTNHRVGIGTASPGSKLTVAGTVESTSTGFKFPDGTTQDTASYVDYREVGGSANINTYDDTVVVVGNSGAVTLTLPAANTVTSGRKFYIKDGGSGTTYNIAINRSGTDTIDGSTSVSITSNYGVVVLASNGFDKYYKLN